MRMNKARMLSIAKHYPKMSISKIAKTYLVMEGNGRSDYSFKEDMAICKQAVIRAIKWVKATRKRNRKRFINNLSFFKE